jgi:hypothetical protein
MRQKAAAFITGITIKRGKFGHGECGSISFHVFDEPMTMAMASCLVFIREKMIQSVYGSLVSGEYNGN